MKDLPDTPVARTKSAARRRWLRPVPVLTVMAAVVLVIAVFTPQESKTDQQFTSFSTAASGTRLVYDLAARLGWKVQRRTSERPPPTSRHLINVVLEPDEPLDASDTHALLETVRAGGGLLVAGEAGAVADSIGYLVTKGGFVAERDEAQCSEHKDPLGLTIAGSSKTGALKWRKPPPSRPVVFTTLDATGDDTDGRTAFVGVELGLGRVAIAGSGDLFGNDVVRRCRLVADVAFVRALEYLRNGDGTPTFLVFDEFHHGYGVHPGSFGAIATYAAETQSGHALLQAALAGILLLIAAAPRVIAPRQSDRVPRRSPLEHADALAHAYESVKATRTVTMRLLSGVRRRSGLWRAGRSLDDDGFLSQVASSWPSVSADAETVRRALRQPLPAAELPAVGAALTRIEAALSLPRSSRRG